jgi:hypothetical protein
MAAPLARVAFRPERGEWATVTPRMVKQKLEYLVRIACQTADGKEVWPAVW